MADFETETVWSEREDAAPAGWPIRPLLLALLGLVTGLASHYLLGDEPFYRFEPSAWTLAQLAVLTITAGLIGFTVERRLWWASILFSLVCGVVAGAVVWWNGPVAGWAGGDGWRILCLFLAIAIAAPLFQAARDSEALRFPYKSVHDHAWTNIVLWGACWLFVAISFALMLLLAQLFHLIKIDFLKDLFEKYWFNRALLGLAFGGALGLLREHQMVVRLLQRVVATVLAVLAPVLAVGLILFVLALPFTGLGALWDATSATTPILLACVIGSLILANAVIGDVPEHERNFPLLKFGAMGLALVVFPLAVIAAIAIGLRIGQYGFTPERLWALTFVAIATAYAFAYLVSLLRGRLHWTEVVRPANLRLAFAVCGVALLLATPLVSFNAISTRDQVARLETGRIAPDKFDWAALAWDFGEPGKAAVKRLQGSADPAIVLLANKAAASTNRWEMRRGHMDDEQWAEVVANLRLLPAGTALPAGLRDALGGRYSCDADSRCTLIFLAGGQEALLFQDSCFVKVEPGKESGPAQVAVTMVPSYCANGQRFAVTGGKWAETAESGSSKLTDAQWAEMAAAYNAGRIEVRPITRRQVFVGEVPVGSAFE